MSEGRCYLYVLLGQTPVPEPAIEEWSRWIENPENCIVKQEHVGDVFVSTVFLGIDVHFGRGSGPPLLFETMTFVKRANVGRDHVHDLDFMPAGTTFGRCATWLDAERQHRAACDAVRAREAIL